MINTFTKKLDNFFKNKEGKVVLMQAPNPPLYAWLFFAVSSKIVEDPSLSENLGHLGDASGFVWAYLELRSGESAFRKWLGGIVIVWKVYRILFS